MSLADSLVASSSRPLSLRKRADLTARRHNYQGRVYWVVKEPIGLRYFRFQEEEFAVLNMLREGATLEDIKEQFEKEFAPHKITYQDLQHFIGTLHRSGLVVSDAPGQGPQLKKRRDERVRQETLAKFSNILAVRFKGIDPQWLLELLYPFTRWMFSPVALAFFTALAISALLLLGVQFDVFRSRLPAFDQFFGPRNWGYLIVVLAVTKIIHEFGHGLLCHHYGGECHEMGVMFLVLTPCLYCNVSDSWMLPSKWQRAAIGAGGIYFELIMASIATFVWWFSEPGMLNHLALRVMFICSVSTVIFNGNPLLRFDGYYILSDILEIPNLRQKASKILQTKMAELCLGIEMPEDPFLPQQNRAMFGLYTIAAVAYRWFIFFSIMFFLNQVFEPYGLKVVGQAIAIMGLYGLVVQPLWQGGKFLHVPGRMDQVKWHRVWATVGVVALIIVGILLIPVPKNVTCAFQLLPRNAVMVTAERPGKLVKVHVERGQSVAGGEPIASLENFDLEWAVVQAENELASAQKQLEMLKKSEIPGDANRIMYQRRIVENARDRLQKTKQQYDKLEVRAPVAGTVFPTQRRPEQPPQEGALRPWYGSTLDERNLGAYLDKGSPLCLIATPGEFEAELTVDQKDLPYIKESDNVKMVLESVTDRAILGVIEKIETEELREAPKPLSNAAGGTLATRTDAAGVERPLSATYRALVPVEDPKGIYQSGFRGTARIRAGYQTIGSRLWEYLTRTFHFYI